MCCRTVFPGDPFTPETSGLIASPIGFVRARIASLRIKNQAWMALLLASSSARMSCAIVFIFAIDGNFRPRAAFNDMGQPQNGWHDDRYASLRLELTICARPAFTEVDSA
jgi:hypothetical protein